MVSREDVARAIAELQLLEQIINEFQIRIATLDAAIREHENAVAFIEEMKKSSGDMEILIPIGGGNFVHGKVTLMDNIEVSIGSGVVMRKTLDEGHQILLKRKEEMINVRDAYIRRLQEHMTRAAELRRFLESVRTE